MSGAGSVLSSLLSPQGSSVGEDIAAEQSLMGTMETSPGWRMSGQFPLFFSFPFFAEQARKQKISFRCALTHLKN